MKTLRYLVFFIAALTLVGRLTVYIVHPSYARVSEINITSIHDPSPYSSYIQTVLKKQHWDQKIDKKYYILSYHTHIRTNQALPTSIELYCGMKTDLLSKNTRIMPIDVNVLASKPLEPSKLASVWLSFLVETELNQSLDELLSRFSFSIHSHKNPQLRIPVIKIVERQTSYGHLKSYPWNFLLSHYLL